MAACLVFACGGPTTTSTEPPSTTNPSPPPNPPSFGPTDAGHPDPGHTDGGTGGTYIPDAGHPDAGTPQPDAGLPGTDSGSSGGGSTDGGAKPTAYNLPTIANWQFFGVQNNGPVHVYGTAMDEGGNLWVAGGEEGLFLMTPGEQAKGSAAQFKQFTMDDGLHPYGYMPDGGDVSGDHYLNVISVAGGPAGTVYVGYLGKHSTVNDDPCEEAWDVASNPYYGDPSVYKSGDADRAELQADGTLKVVHYDIFSGPKMVCGSDRTHCNTPGQGEPAGRERVCSIYRIAYDKSHNNLWFGGNHGFAWGDPQFPGSAATGCFGDPGPAGQMPPPPNSYGNYKCSGVLEHAHPAFNCENGSACTFRYYAMDADPNGNLWVGGWDRSLVWNMGNRGANFWGYEGTQWTIGFPTQIDVWADPGGPANTTPDQWNQDRVLGVAAMPDGSAYFASVKNGAAHIDASGNISYLSGEIDKHLSAAAYDPATGAVWFGGYGGVSILKNGSWTDLNFSYFGPDLTSGKIADIQSQEVSGARKVVVGFHHTDGDAPAQPMSFGGPDAVGIYSGSGLP